MGVWLLLVWVSAEGNRGGFEEESALMPAAEGKRAAINTYLVRIVKIKYYVILLIRTSIDVLEVLPYSEPWASGGLS